MVDVRRAYGRWLIRRLLWLVPSLAVSVVVGLKLHSHPELSAGIRIPSLALAVGVTAVFLALTAQTLLVNREKSLGRSRRAQLLRKELRPYPVLALASLVLLLALMAVPSLFPAIPPIAAPAVFRRPGPAIAGKPAPSPAVAEASGATAGIPPSAPEPSPVPQVLPEIARPPQLPFLWEDLELPSRLLVQEEPGAGTDRFGMKHRPGADDYLHPEFASGSNPFDRAGLPSESDSESWVPPEVRIEMLLVTRSGPWRGAGLETHLDLPFGRDDSIRWTYLFVSLADQEKLDGLDPSFGWHRGTLEYVHRMAGYTRQATFDLALRIGLSVDHLRVRDGDVRYDISFRYSPWVGIESALWEDSGVGLILQAGHSFATRLGGSSSSATDVKAIVRIDLGESSALELGYRIVSVRFRDQVRGSNDLVDRMSQAFMGPIAGLTVRF